MSRFSTNTSLAEQGYIGLSLCGMQFSHVSISEVRFLQGTDWHLGLAQVTHQLLKETVDGAAVRWKGCPSGDLCSCGKTNDKTTFKVPRQGGYKPSPQAYHLVQFPTEFGY